jgi:SAM-dependent methyltransferase
VSPHPGHPLAFEGLVADYAAARPSYPDAVFDALPPLQGRRVLELGAGTGIATRALLARGASVLATDLGPKVLRANVIASPGLPAVVAAAEQLPVRTGTIDLVCGAQMWHWVDVARAAPEVARVLHPGGALALWWNEESSDGQPWYDAQQSELERLNPLYRRDYRQKDWSAGLAHWLPRVEGPREFAWSREISLVDYERLMRSKSYVQELGPRLESFLAADRDRIERAFPEGMVRQRYRTRLWLARPRPLAHA